MSISRIPHLARAVAQYRLFIRKAFLGMLAYRMRYYMGIVTYFLFVAVHYFIWQALYAELPPGGRINGFTLAEMVTYVAVGWIARSSYFSNIDEEMDDIVRTGQVSIYLLRPVNFQGMMFAQALGEALFRVAFFSAPIALVIVYIFPVLMPATFWHGLLFLWSSWVGFFVLAQINFLVGLMAFRLQSINGITRMKYYGIQLLSGLLIPLSFFPAWAQTVVEALPFKYIASTPLKFYLGHTALSEAPVVVASQILWMGTLALLGAVFWGRELRHLTIQGG